MQIIMQNKVPISPCYPHEIFYKIKFLDTLIVDKLYFESNGGSEGDNYFLKYYF